MVTLHIFQQQTSSTYVCCSVTQCTHIFRLHGVLILLAESCRHWINVHQTLLRNISAVEFGPARLVGRPGNAEISTDRCGNVRRAILFTNEAPFLWSVLCGSGNLILPELATTAYSCDRHGTDTAWSRSARPGNVIPVSKTSTLLGGGGSTLSIAMELLLLGLNFVLC